MDGLKRLVTILVLLFVVAAPAAALAQSYGGQMNPQSNAYQGGAQQAQQGQTGQAGQGNIPQTNKNLADSISSMPKISMFAAAVKAGGYDDLLSSQGPYMVFAPTDDSLQSATGITDVNSLTSDQTIVSSLAEDCIVNQVNQQQGQQSQANSGQLSMTTLSGKTITATKANGKITANGVHIVYATKATNGMLIITDGLVNGPPSSSGTSASSGVIPGTSGAGG